MSARASAGAPQQRGMALLVVMVVLALGSWLALGSARTAWLNENLVSSQSDQQRATAAAHALLKDAQDDIQGLRADGTPCSSAPTDAGCRGQRGDNRPFFPTHEEHLPELIARIGSAHACRYGICLPTSVTSLQPQALASRLLQDAAAGAPTTLVASYGQYTGTTPSQPLLNGASARAWYWVEVFRLDSAADASVLTAADPRPPFVYRINAYVQGHKTGTRVLLRSLFVPKAPPPRE
jgi:type IV pilus assembly protein PilX